MLSVCLPLPLPGLIPTAPMSSQGGGGRRIPFWSASEAGDGQGCVQSQSHLLASAFPPISSYCPILCLGKVIGGSLYGGDTVAKAVI